jgi:hypothetical protein
MCSPWRPVKPSDAIAALASLKSQSRYSRSAHAFATTRAPLRGPILDSYVSISASSAAGST